MKFEFVLKMIEFLDDAVTYMQHGIGIIEPIRAVRTQRLIIIDYNLLEIIGIHHGLHNFSMIFPKENTRVIGIMGQNNVAIVVNDIALLFVAVTGFYAAVALEKKQKLIKPPISLFFSGKVLTLSMLVIL